MEPKITKILQNLGLNEKESKVYQASLSLGSSKVSELAELSGIQRTNVYPIIQKLQKRGLIQESVTGFKKMYLPEDPERLFAMIEEKKHHLTEVLPGMKELYGKSKQESVLKRYRGLKAIKHVYDDLLKDLKMDDYYYSIADVEKWQNLSSYFFEEHVKKRSKICGNIKLLFQNSETARYRRRVQTNLREEVKLIKKEHGINTDMIVTPHMLVMFQLDYPLEAIVITNKSMIHLHKKLFEIIWQGDA